MNSAQFGQVPVRYLNKKEKRDYQDDAEQFLHAFFDRPQSEKQAEIDMILQDASWATLYHLTPQREVLLDWYPLKEDATILEIGAGCGALTGMYTRKAKNVIANELMPTRGEIIAKRYADKSNLEVIIGNLLDIRDIPQVDYISVIGVLEYAGRFIPHNHTDDPYEPFVTFLHQLHQYLKPDGTILLAIENKIGIKYIAGGKEDHYGDLFSSLENYPNYDGIRTFSKSELEDVFHRAGFKKTQFFYPFPDYKLPTTVMSEEGLNIFNGALASFAQINDLSRPRLALFNEIPFLASLQQEQILPQFSNSFLVEAQI